MGFLGHARGEGTKESRIGRTSSPRWGGRKLRELYDKCWNHERSGSVKYRTVERIECGIATWVVTFYARTSYRRVNLRSI